MHIRIGTDIVLIPRVRSLFERFGDRFLQRVYTIAEQEEFHRRCADRRSPENAIGFLAGRWAAKEAVVKALGTGWRGVRYTDISIGHQPSGAPAVMLTPTPQTQPWLQGSWQLSLSHDGDYAIATALWSGDLPQEPLHAPLESTHPCPQEGV
ncbi:MAG TPA: holo-ACP synthase [Candidatus Obscuribacterales bacterium]